MPVAGVNVMTGGDSRFVPTMYTRWMLLQAVDSAFAPVRFELTTVGELITVWSVEPVLVLCTEGATTGAYTAVSVWTPIVSGSEIDAVIVTLQLERSLAAG